MTPRVYWISSREPRYSFAFAVPLLLLYEGLAFALSGSSFAGVRNGADVLLKTVFVALGGRHGLTVFGLVLLAAGAVGIWRDRRRHPEPVETRAFGLMLGESVVYAFFFGGIVSRLTTVLLRSPLSIQGGGAAQLDLGTQLVVSLGAGLYEELLFRVLLVSGLVALAMVLGMRRSVAVGVAVVVSALIFSAFHYIGPLGDTFTIESFAFRAIAGLLLSGLYVARGFGIAAWTHALYDVGLALL